MSESFSQSVGSFLTEEIYKLRDENDLLNNKLIRAEREFKNCPYLIEAYMMHVRFLNTEIKQLKEGIK